MEASQELGKFIDAARFETKRLQTQARKTSIALARLADELEAHGIKLEIVSEDESLFPDNHTARRAQ